MNDLTNTGCPSDQPTTPLNGLTCCHQLSIQRWQRELQDGHRRTTVWRSTIQNFRSNSYFWWSTLHNLNIIMTNKSENDYTSYDHSWIINKTYRFRYLLKIIFESVSLSQCWNMSLSFYHGMKTLQICPNCFSFNPLWWWHWSKRVACDQILCPDY